MPLFEKYYQNVNVIYTIAYVIICVMYVLVVYVDS